jgi:hypothetical protein
VVYRDVTRQAKGLYRLKHVGALWGGLAYLSRYNSGWFCHTRRAQGRRAGPGAAGGAAAQRGWRAARLARRRSGSCDKQTALGRSRNWRWRAMAARLGACSRGLGGARVDAARERVVRQLAAGGAGHVGAEAQEPERELGEHV